MSEKQPKGESVGALFLYLFLQCPIPRPHPENKTTVFTVRFLAQMGAGDQEKWECLGSSNLLKALGLSTSREDYKGKTWDKMDCTLLYPSHPSAFCVPVAWLIQQLHPQTPGRSHLEAETQPKLPPGKESHRQGCELCFGSVLIL